MRYIEIEQIREDRKRFIKALDANLASLDALIEAFTDDTGMMITEPVKDRVKNIVLEQVFGPERGAVENEHLPFIRNSMRRLWNKINRN
jgi:hypothetical protein